MASRDVVQLTDTNFRAEALEAPAPVLVDFRSPWRGPCRMVAPVVGELAREYTGRGRVGS